jgi:hypothetical protein
VRERTNQILVLPLLAVSAALVTGCMSPEQSRRAAEREAAQKAAQERQVRAQMESKCDSYGFKRGSSDFSRCLLSLDQQRMDERSRRIADQTRHEEKSLRCLAANGFAADAGYHRCMAR